MPRNKEAHRLHDMPDSLKAHHPNGVFSFFNPTRVYYRTASSQTSDSEPKNTTSNGSQDSSNAEVAPLPGNMHYFWRSRDNRKARHAVIVDTSHPAPVTPPNKSSSLSATMAGIKRMATDWNYWDVSWWVAVIFTLGSVVWCINGCFSFFPIIHPSSEFPGEVSEGAPWTAWLGATIFEIGSVLLMLEAVNESRTACFGWAVDKQLGREEDATALVPDKQGCLHRHRKGSRKDDDVPTWTWWPSWNELKTHHIRQIGFWACSWQMFGATIFWISGFTAIPKVIDMENLPLTNGIFWTPQVIGGSGFIISSTLFMLETQKYWYLPAPFTLGWHVGFWNLIGAVGFTLCGIFGYYPDNSGLLFESILSTFWGSWAFLIGSLAQWYEAVDKHPVETVRLPETAYDQQRDVEKE